MLENVDGLSALHSRERSVINGRLKALGGSKRIRPCSDYVHMNGTVQGIGNCLPL